MKYKLALSFAFAPFGFVDQIINPVFQITLFTNSILLNYTVKYFCKYNKAINGAATDMIFLLQ